MDEEALGARDFWLPDDVLLAIGKVTVAAARLEHGTHMLLEVLWGEPRGRFSDVAANVKRQVRLFEQVVGMGSEAVDRVLEWVERAKATMRERDRLMHSAAFQTLTQEGPHTGVRIRSGETWDLRAEDVEDLAGRLRDLAVECMRAVLTVGAVVPKAPGKPSS